MWLECMPFSSYSLLKPNQNLLTHYRRTAYDADQPFADLLNTAMVLPIFDGGNVGIRRRHMQELMLSKDYDSWASTYGPSK